MRYESFLTKSESACSMVLLVKVILVGGSTRIPKVQELLKDYHREEPIQVIQLDEAVVFGATIQAAVLSGQVDFNVPMLQKKTISFLTLGIELNGGAFLPIIKGNTDIPTKISKMYAVVFLRHFYFLIISSSVSQLLLTTNLL